MQDATSRVRIGTAIHEAGHVVVAWALGIKVQGVIVGIGGSDGKGRAYTDSTEHLPLIDQVAVCAAGTVAQDIFDAPTDELASLIDEKDIANLIYHSPEEDRESIRDAGFERAERLLNQHRAKVGRLARMLVESTELNEGEVERILSSDDD